MICLATFVGLLFSICVVLIEALGFYARLFHFDWFVAICWIVGVACYLRFISSLRLVY